MLNACFFFRYKYVKRFFCIAKWFVIFIDIWNTLVFKMICLQVNLCILPILRQLDVAGRTSGLGPRRPRKQESTTLVSVVGTLPSTSVSLPKLMAENHPRPNTHLTFLSVMSLEKPARVKNLNVLQKLKNLWLGKRTFSMDLNFNHVKDLNVAEYLYDWSIS